MQLGRQFAGGMGRNLGGRKVRLGANALVMTVAFIAILVFLNVLAQRYHKRWDLTAEHDFSLSQQSIKIVESLKQPVQIIGFFGKQDASQRNDVESRLKEYTSHNRNISYRFVDPDTDPVAARNYNITSYGTLVVDSGGHKQQALGSDEQAITTAILKATQTTPTTVYFLTGHRERAIDGSDAASYSSVRTLLQQDNFTVEPLNLTITTTVPLSNTVLVVADPQTALSDTEQQAVGMYVSRGGRLMVLGNPLVDPPLAPLLAKTGLTWNNDVVIDQQSELGSAVAPAVVQYPASAITKDLNGQASVFPTVRTLTMTNTDGLTVTAILQSSKNSEAATDIQGEQIKLSANDKHGPLTFGYSVEGPIRTTDTITSPLSTNPRMVVIGDADFAANNALQVGQANGALFRNTIAWLAAQDQLISLPAKSPVDRTVFLTAAQSQTLFYGNTLGIPLLVLLAGVAAWWRRR